MRVAIRGEKGAIKGVANEIGFISTEGGGGRPGIFVTRTGQIKFVGDARRLRRRPDQRFFSKATIYLVAVQQRP